MNDLTDRVSHFDFGKNWENYSNLISQERVELAQQSVERLIPDVHHKSFLDIGSGSGLFSLAALKLGAARVHAIDIDEDSIRTTQKVLNARAKNGSWTAERGSVFDLSPDELGTFDVVYSWGVLHHTGDLWRAMECASRMVAPGGRFAFALYERTPLCGAWRLEKKAYVRAGPRTQKLILASYVGLRRIARFLSGKRDSAEIMDRGMEITHDAHDWLGGYPYESTEPQEVAKFMAALGFRKILELPVKVHLGGLLGTGCSEYVYERSN